MHAFEAKALEILCENDEAIEKHNVHVGAFGRGAHCYASANGVLGGTLGGTPCHSPAQAMPMQPVTRTLSPTTLNPLTP